MITVIRTDSGTYNLFGTRDDSFVLQGNLTEKELRELHTQISKQFSTPQPKKS